jgi:uncharacterized protein YaeQ
MGRSCYFARMALTATPYHFKIALSDVDRNVYESLDLRPARHPSESMRYLATRTLAYCLSYEEGIAFSKGGVSSSDEPPLSIRDATGALRARIDIGSPSAERLHRAAKAAERVTIFTHVELTALRREAEARAIHRGELIQVVRFEPSFLDKLESKLERNTSFELVHHAGHLYATFGSVVIEGQATKEPLLAEN